MARTAVQGLGILECPATCDASLRLADLPRALGLDLAKASRLVSAQIGDGYTWRATSSREYPLTGNFRSTAAEVAEQSALHAAARSHRELIRASTQEAMHPGAFERRTLVYSDMEARHSIRLVSAAGKWMLVQIASLVEASLSCLEPEKIDASSSARCSINFVDDLSVPSTRARRGRAHSTKRGTQRTSFRRRLSSELEPRFPSPRASRGERPNLPRHHHVHCREHAVCRPVKTSEAQAVWGCPPSPSRREQHADH